MYNQFYDNDENYNDEERYVRAKFKEMKCLDYKQINDFFEYLFVCCKSTTNSRRHHTRKKHKDTDPGNLSEVFSPIFNRPNYTNKQHVLKPRNITFIGGKTIYGQRVSTI
jgi:hypothetical protein